MICLHLASAAEPVSPPPPPPSKIMRIYQHCVKVIGRGLYCCPLPDLIALLCRICEETRSRAAAHLREKTPGAVSCQNSLNHACWSCMYWYGMLSSRLPKCDTIATMAHKRGVAFHKAEGCQVSLPRDREENIKKTDRPSGIISAPGCCYLGRPGNPPEHWVEYPPSGAHAHKAWPCDTSAGGAASQIYLGNQSEPRASPNPAGASSAFLPVIAPRFITDGVNENTDFSESEAEAQEKENRRGCNNKQNSKISTRPDLYLFIQTRGLRQDSDSWCTATSKCSISTKAMNKWISTTG